MLLPLHLNLQSSDTPRPPRPSDNERSARAFKPLGLPPERRKRNKQSEAVEARVQETAQIAEEVAAKIAREFGEETRQIEAREEARQILEMSQAEIDFEIGVLLKKKIKRQEDELLLLLLMAASSA